ncbi:hypothetical protein [Marinicella litoralis]|uniref:Uncharacterized protein n=1 Tax=Marinicella litoralis TaxID=644220 RepID=A0A4R6XDT8_9GAMM|nr:hypothetical protein [Marinicella litoralis]TDR17476.1 hypothetical protein C8D91_2534 [Marinicella litoralis]
MKTTVLFFTLTLMMNTNTGLAKNPADEAAEKSLSAVTVFIDVNRLTRKNLAAKKMTESHNEFAVHGFELVGVSPYTENGDLEGFFVSYKKK